MKLTDTQWAVICALHAEPNYRFLGNEGRVAQRMEQLGWLQGVGEQRYRVTPLGERVYAQHNRPY